MEENSALGYLIQEAIKVPKREEEIRRGLSLWKSAMETILFGSTEFEGERYTNEQLYEVFMGELKGFEQFLRTLTNEQEVRGGEEEWENGKVQE